MTVRNKAMTGIAKRFQPLSAFFQISLIILFSVLCPQVWAAQDAIVIAEKAVIYADKTMTSPVGFIQKGKRVSVGEVPRNKAQLYPIVVSGKVAYIRTIDVSTEIESLDSNRLVAERFLRVAEKKIESVYTLSAFTYATQVSLSQKNDQLEDKDPFVWNGFNFKGAVKTSKNWDFGVVLGYAEGQESKETFRMIETGIDLSYRIFNGDYFVFKWQNQALAVPFSSYSLGTKYRVNGYGFSAGSGLAANVIMGNHWGLEVFGGFYYTGLYGFDVPRPYKSITPTFIGSRLGLGATYQY